MAFRSASTAYASGSNSLTGSAPTGTTAGDILIAIFSQDGSGATLTFPSGWTKVRSDNITHGDAATVSWGWKVATGSDSYAFTGSTGNDIGVCIAAYTGRDGTTPVETSTVNNPDSTSIPTSPVSVTATGFTTANIDDIVFLGQVDTNGTNGTWSAPAAMTLRTQTTNSGNFCALCIADFLQSSAGVVANQTGTWTGTQGNPLGYLVALQPPASTVVGPGSTPLQGPGISPNKQTQFAARKLSNAIAANVTVALTGQSATFTAGNLTPSRTVALTGSSATFSAGTMRAFVATQGKSYVPGPGISPDYRQLFNSRNLSSFIPTAGDVTIALTGQSASFSSGSLSPSLSIPVVGQAGTFSTGNMGDTDSGVLLGQAATFSSGLLTPNITVSLTGQSSTFAAGTVAPAPLISLTGGAVTFSGGALTPSTSIAVSGLAGTFSAGNVIAPGDVTVALTGQAATFSAGTMTASLIDADIGGDPPRRRKTRNVIKNGKFVQEKIPNWPFDQQAPHTEQIEVRTAPPTKPVQITTDEDIVHATISLMFELM